MHPRVIAICGCPGSGKSTLATLLAERLQAVRLDMDDFQDFTQMSPDALSHWIHQGADFNQLDVSGFTRALAAAASEPGYLVVESHFGRAHTDTGKLFDLVFWLDTPADLALARKLSALTLAPTPLADYLTQYVTLIQPLLAEQAQRLAGTSDARLNGTQSPTELCDQIMQKLSGHSDNGCDYLKIDAYLETPAGACALAYACEQNLLIGLDHPKPTAQWLDLCQSAGLQREGAQLLLSLLVGNAVIVAHAGNLQLDTAFAPLLRFADLIQTKVHFSRLLVQDLARDFEHWLGDGERFMADSQLFTLFDYQRAKSTAPQAVEKTADWVKLVTAYTHHEAQVFTQHFDFNGVSRWLDIGGNSGEFVRQLCLHKPTLIASVVDLPGVCAAAAQLQSGKPGMARVQFVAGDGLHDPIPINQDCVSFKSFLHDWPEHLLQDWLQRAFQSLLPGGQLVIFERTSGPLSHAQIGFGQLPILLFQRAYRGAHIYRQHLMQAGFERISEQEIQLDFPFTLVRAFKPH